MISGNIEVMSVDNSVVDSSVTEWKPDVENKKFRESRNEKVVKDAYHFSEEDQDHSSEQVGTSNARKRGQSSDTRYFIIKSLNHENIQLSIQRGIWATQVMNEAILEEAYLNSGKVILIFSVNMSGFFQGYAQMMSSVGWGRDNVWSHGHGGGKPWGRSFKVKWLRLHDLPFQKTLHLKNPLNQYKPVKISRDCQELPQDIGEALCELIDGENGMDENETSYDLYGLRDKEYGVDPAHIPLAGPPSVYPSMFYQQKSEASRFNVAHQRQSGAFHNISNTTESSFNNRNISCVDMGGEGSSLFDGWDMSAERSLHANVITDDDILEMTYEEYLEAHGIGNQISHQPVKESSRRSRESSVSKEHDDDSYSRLRSKKKSRRHHHHRQHPYSPK